jgi:primosomal replication protein N
VRKYGRCSRKEEEARAVDRANCQIPVEGGGQEFNQIDRYNDAVKGCFNRKE